MLEEARLLASQYRLMIDADPDGGYIGCTLEMPMVMGGGRTISACAADVLDATIASIALMIESGKQPPAPASEGKRDQQVNIRLTSEERVRLEQAASGEGFRSLSDFLRSAGLARARSRA